MNKILSLLFVAATLTTVTVTAQSVAINTDGSTANASSLLEIKSTNKGVLIPRMTAVQRTGIASPVNGLLVFDTDSASFSFYNGSTWLFLNANPNIGKDWSTKGNAGTTAANFMGTTDNQDVIFKRNNLKAGLLNSTNTAFAVGALNNNISGFSNVAIGKDALYNSTDGSNLLAVGDSALYNNGIGATGFQDATRNTAVGSKALFGNTTGQRNTAVGYKSLTNNVSGDYNTSTGLLALASNVAGDYNTAYGFQALYSNNSIENTAIGANALFSDSTGAANTATGVSALYGNTSGSFNTATGVAALGSNTTGGFNTATGLDANHDNKTGRFNTSNGAFALYNNRTGSFNVALGTSALESNLTGSNNVAVGASAGATPSFSNVNGYYNTYIGDSSNMLPDRINSTVIGSKAYTSTDNSMVLGSINGVNGATADVKVGIGVTNPIEKLEIGKGRLRFRGNVTGGNAHGITWTNNAGTTDRAFIGMETDDLFAIYNFGFPTGWNVRLHNTTGEMGINKQPGTTSSESRLQIKQASVGASRGIGIETAINTNRWDMWVDNTPAPDYNFNYNGSLRGYFQNATGNYIVASDKRFKKDISSFPASLSTINQLKTYQYHYLENTAADPFSIGFMAQDVQKLFPDAVSEKVMEDGNKRLGVNYQYFTVLAIKGLQEQQVNMQAQDKKIEVLENQIAELKKLVEENIKK